MGVKRGEMVIKRTQYADFWDYIAGMRDCETTADMRCPKSQSRARITHLISAAATPVEIYICQLYQTAARIRGRKVSLSVTWDGSWKT